MPLASRRSRHPLASKLVPSFLVVSFAVRLSSVSGGLIGRGGGGWNFHSKGGGGVHSRLEGRSPTVKKVSATALLLIGGRERGSHARLQPSVLALVSSAHCFWLLVF